MRCQAMAKNANGIANLRYRINVKATITWACFKSCSKNKRIRFSKSPYSFHNWSNTSHSSKCMPVIPEASYFCDYGRGFTHYIGK